MWSPTEDRALREAARAWLDDVTLNGSLSVSREQLSAFEFNGERIPLIDRHKGIRKPRMLTAALSFVTTYRPAGRERPYDDAVGEDRLPRYKWRGTDPMNADNRALRSAMEQQLPLIWFWGIGPGEFTPIYPVYLLDEEPADHQFIVALGEHLSFSHDQLVATELMRKWTTQTVTRRVHQPVFRQLVMRAYQTRCTICELRHGVLLDAAHIVEDKDPRGVAAPHNGLALCKIHHAAYDAGIIGVRPDYEIEIRQDILDEIDGPMLEHGIKSLHGEKLRVIPKIRSERPSQSLLQVHYERFLNA